jgi:hypothetical protein
MRGGFLGCVAVRGIGCLRKLTSNSTPCTIKVIENCYGSYIIIKPMLVTKHLRTFNKRHFAYLFVILTLTAIDAFARPIKTPPPPPPPPPVVPALLAMISGLSSLVLP